MVLGAPVRLVFSPEPNYNTGRVLEAILGSQ
jgi:hypothetical protein